MDKNKVIKEYKKKINLLKKYDKFYYQKSDPIVSDKEYDELKKWVLKIESEYKDIKSKNSPSGKVGYKPSKNFQKVSHRVPMLSLANAFTEEDLLNFEKKILNFLSENKGFKISYSAEPKIDGISASLIYRNGIFEKGLSRGDGREGEDITANLETIKDIPKIIPDKDFPKDIDVRGEVFIQNSNFENLKDKFANPRNAASGSLRQKNPEDTKKIPLNFIAYTFGFEQGLKQKKQSDYLKKLDEWGFKTNPLNKTVAGIKNLIQNYNEVEQQRANLNFDIDGIVYKVNDFDLQKRLGNVANAPRWAIAHKFSSNKAISKILDIDIQIGRTGALTPVAKIKPINIGGVLVSNATLHNEDEINRKDIRIGDTVTVERAGDVIPHILSVDINKREKNSSKFIFPNKCPFCGSKTVKEFNKVTKKIDAVRRCSSEDYYCDKISIEKLKHFVSKDAFNIDGLGKKIIEGFWQLNFIKFPQDIFKLDYKKIEKLEGWGKLSTENLKYSINEKKNISLERLIFALGIRHIGLENAKLLAKHFISFLKFQSLSKTKNYDDLLNIDGIGETQVSSMKVFFSNKINLKVLDELGKILVIKNATAAKQNGLFKNKTFLVTGKLSGISRAEVKSLIEENSGITVSSVTNKLKYLIIGEKPTRRKVESAKQLDIKIINQEDFLKMLNKTS
ncbi:NAD-dependent DNA ligase LigA [Candidatus Pelagibacter sp. FZCC0015]|uniref:NAD-dependent DNA ligase LigA n=1 Tax=Candidatus Pelagibacter sp. FZCC0015 TaxID=2268451 RepID=UPI0011A7E1EE|nr:NAD-dependent DNA ligase LigA [Candidatus Pelagibacter sp. FZCC0015]